ncbi:hypothetical protein FGO68_gene16130 [Halteria grandinella]|uniref:Uncharacterized protein n=1 Tax=Halteria grandinella TaxID=5974 RepID=A0A8J8NNF1_HALGN|nr:hypothetical protein FGO68_gene16130 [Halteria grandinella]
MGQQSLAEFMGLHVDIDQIAADNRKRQGIRKFGFLVNQLGKLTPEQKKQLIAENRIKYGLSEEVVANIKLPAPCHLLQVHSAEKILNPRLKLTTIEKINHFIKLKEALESKLDMLRQGKLILTGGQGRSLGALNKRGRPGANSFGGGPQKLMLASGVEGTGFYAGISSMKATPVEKGSRKKRAVKEPQDGSDVDEELVESDSEMRDCAAEMYTPDHQAFPGQGKSLLQARVKATTTTTTETTASTFDATPQ